MTFSLKPRFHLIALLGVSQLLVSAPSAYAATDAQQRALYTKAKAAFNKGDSVLADRLTQQLGDYPLVPYLTVRQIKRDISRLDDQSVKQFVVANRATPFGDDVQIARLNNLKSQQNWTAYLSAFEDYPLSKSKYQCDKAYATLATGKIQEAMTLADSMWVVGYSQDSACDPLFAEWMKKGHPTSDQGKARFWNAVSSKNFSIAKYAEKFITDTADKQDAALFWKVQNDLSLIEDKSLLHDNKPEHGIILAYAVRELARKDIHAAADVWIRDRHRLAVTPEKQHALNDYFGKRYAKGFRSNAKQVLAKLDPDFKEGELTEWRIRLELADKDWKGALGLITLLPDDMRSSDRWRYWRETLKARLDSNYTPDYSQVVKERSFYGFLASELSNDPFRMNHRPANITEEQKARILGLPAMQRMRELLSFGLEYNARVEWNALVKQLDESDKHAAAHIAYDWGWYDQAIRGAALVKAWDDLDIRFPKPHLPLFAELATARNINRTWAIAIARQESAYHQTARSRVGARGLMQLMPATARETAKKYDIDYKHPDELFQLRTNVELGTAYLSQMLERFDGNTVYATAAYNAGPHRVKRWLEQRGDLPLDAWIETIPFDETRKYVQNVLTYRVIYDVLSSNPSRLLNDKETASLALSSLNLKKGPLETKVPSTQIQ
ncbi:transglycosylase SLT domain-containing protein [Neptunomonas phycophila]|uniref:transglycosylase SLT domain-containing protein n=1 Tax=Neptunomonas phycophila TaxID=1572645 RepID=UPI0026E40CF5|nr:transglycosylase SLT domain-containing protein [Neptunomonas phycophila]MDO6783111.1 transglycosylase SLT domain-containing protein [Neptunomonas phycophila]